MLTVSNLSKRFGDLRAVDELSLMVERGEIIGLIGPNGSGKSTLLSLIAGELKPDAGSIRLEGQEISGAPMDQIFQLGLMRSFQQPSLFFRMTALDNSLLPVKEQRGEHLAQAPWHRLWRGQESQLAKTAGALLERLQLSPRATSLASDLSGGQMKLLELGRTLMGEPQLLLLDEPTAGVAPSLALAIFDQIEQMRRESELTLLIVEHRLEILFSYVDRIYVMHLGKVIAQGTPAEIEQNRHVREVYFGE